ncbi:hypothetical protein [Piscirickettsia salmonis]|uniref:hypothetical protein n=1 Tax=Piscirickettsia salmonis TaxID=1238 RepID=UPI0012FED108
MTSSAIEWSFFQDESGRWRWLHIDTAGQRSISPIGFVVETAAKSMQSSLAMRVK